MNCNEIEEEVQDKGLTAPRVTLDDIEANIVWEYFFTGTDGILGAACIQKIRNDDIADTFAHPSLGLLTFCVLVLKNGFTVTGESACASPENFDAEIGKQIARQNAEQKIWPLMGYQLKEQLFQATQPAQVPA